MSERYDLGRSDPRAVFSSIAVEHEKKRWSDSRAWKTMVRWWMDYVVPAGITVLLVLCVLFGGPQASQGLLEGFVIGTVISNANNGYRPYYAPPPARR